MTDISHATHDLISKAIEAGAHLRVIDVNGTPLSRNQPTRDPSIVRGDLKTFPHGIVAIDLAAMRFVGVRMGAEEAEQIDELFSEYGERAAPALIEPDGCVTFLFEGDKGSSPLFLAGYIPLPAKTRTGSPDIFAAIKTGAVRTAPGWLLRLFAGKELPAPPAQAAVISAGPKPAAPSCASCRAFRPLAGKLGQGICALASPTFFALDAGGYVISGEAGWPAVMASDSCGQFARGRADGDCADCEFFRPTHPDRRDVTGLCTRRAPLRPCDNRGVPVSGRAVFPRVQPDDGCSEFTAISKIREVA